MRLRRKPRIPRVPLDSVSSKTTQKKNISSEEDEQNTPVKDIIKLIENVETKQRYEFFFSLCDLCPAQEAVVETTHALCQQLTPSILELLSHSMGEPFQNWHHDISVAMRTLKNRDVEVYHYVKQFCWDEYEKDPLLYWNFLSSHNNAPSGRRDSGEPIFVMTPQRISLLSDVVQEHCMSPLCLLGPFLLTSVSNAIKTSFENSGLAPKLQSPQGLKVQEFFFSGFPCYTTTHAAKETLVDLCITLLSLCNTILVRWTEYFIEASYNNEIVSDSKDSAVFLLPLSVCISLATLADLFLDNTDKATLLFQTKDILDSLIRFISTVPTMKILCLSVLRLVWDRYIWLMCLTETHLPCSHNPIPVVQFLSSATFSDRHVNGLPSKKRLKLKHNRDPTRIVAEEIRLFLSYSALLAVVHHGDRLMERRTKQWADAISKAIVTFHSDLDEKIQRRFIYVIVQQFGAFIKSRIMEMPNDICCTHNDTQSGNEFVYKLLNGRFISTSNLIVHLLIMHKEPFRLVSFCFSSMLNSVLRVLVTRHCFLMETFQAFIPLASFIACVGDFLLRLQDICLKEGHPVDLRRQKKRPLAAKHWPSFFSFVQRCEIPQPPIALWVQPDDLKCKTKLKYFVKKWYGVCVHYLAMLSRHYAFPESSRPLIVNLNRLAKCKEAETRHELKHLLSLCSSASNVVKTERMRSSEDLAPVNMKSLFILPGSKTPFSRTAPLRRIPNK